MKKSILYTGIFLFTLGSVFAFSPPRLDDNFKRLGALYEQRDAIAKGLHELGYDMCLNSRVGRVGRLTKVLNERKKLKKEDLDRPIVFTQEGQQCPPNAKCLKPIKEKKLGARFVLPLKEKVIQGHRAQFKKSQIFERMLQDSERKQYFSGRDSDVSDEDAFHRRFFNRTSCLKGKAIVRGCQLLDPSREVKNTALAKLKKKLQSDKEFLARFDANFACKIADSQKLYTDKLKKVQKLITVEEKAIKKIYRKSKKALEATEEANHRPGSVSDVKRQKKSVQKISPNY